MSDTEFAEKIRSINFGLPSRREPKRTTVDTESVIATTTEHWDDRVDVTVKPSTVRLPPKEPT